LCPGRRWTARRLSRRSRARRAVDDGDKVRVEVRLTAHQVRRLTLAAALLDRPRRALIGDAVEALLQALGEGRLKSCRCFRAGGGVVCGSRSSC
jgi:hypothetical protein